MDVSNYSKKLLDRNKTPKVSLDKCEADNHLLKIGTKTNDNTTANLLRSFPLESDSEYETEEVYELSEWYPPDFWKSNQFMETLNQQVDDALSGGTSNLNHLRNAKEDGNDDNKNNVNNNNNDNKKKDICLTDVTVDDITITMMESQTEKGFFKTL